ncbi:MAG: DUF58 domain-containing protein [Pseudomonadota bacterium]
MQSIHNDAVIQGAYVSLEQLLSLRHQPDHASSAHSKVVGNRAGQKLSKIKGRGVDFAEVRPYQPGDDIRAIDWRVTARKNKPHTKIFREERERPTIIAVDQSQNMFFGSKVRLKSVTAAELATRIAWQNLAAGDRVGGIVIGNHDQALHKPYRTTKSVARFLHDISRFNNQLSNSLATLSANELAQNMNEGMLRIRRLSRNNYRIFVISDFAYSLTFWQEHLHQLARHNQVVLVHVYDPLEEELPPTDHYAVTDGQDRLQFYSGDRQLRDKYRQRHAKRIQALQEICLHDAMSYIAVRTETSQLQNMSWV